MTPVRPRRRAGLFLLALCSRLMALLVLALAAMPGVALAGAVPGELPAYVGRLSTVAGEVRWFDRDSESWLGTPQEPLRNWPVAAGDRLRTGPDGRAELRLGSTTLRLGPGCDLTLQRLDGQGLVLWLESGTLALRLSALLPGEGAAAEVLTAEGRWLPQAPGHYRIARQADARTPATLATTWRGEMSFEGRDSALTVPAGRRADIWLDPANSTRYTWAPVERDAFADWVARDERLDDAPVSARYVQPGVTGWQDLDRNGDWVSHPEYGQVWQPRQVPVGWAPFHDGRWVWVAPWGWTWIDAAPWGFAPFHYGSWVVWRDRWCWSPGPRQERPHYAPALRAWTGGPVVGGGTSININIGNNTGYRPPPPRVVIPVVLPPRMVVAPPTIIVINPPPRAWRGDPVRAAPPSPVPPPHDPEHRGRYDPAPRDQDRRPPDGRDSDRRDPGRREPDRRDPDRREPDRRDRGGPVTAAPAPAPAPVPAAPAPAVPAAGPTTPAPVVPAAGPAAPVPVGLARRFTPPASPAPMAPVAPVANPAAAQTPTPVVPRPAVAPRPSAASPAPPPAPTPAAPRPRDAEPGRTDASQRPDRGDRGTAVR